MSAWKKKIEIILVGGWGPRNEKGLFSWKSGKQKRQIMCWLFIFHTLINPVTQTKGFKHDNK